MANNELLLQYGFPSQNDVIAAAMMPAKQYRGRKRTHGVVYAAMKKKFQSRTQDELIAQGCVPHTPYERLNFTFMWIESGKERDPDNVMCGGIKPILDAIVAVGIIPDDKRRHVGAINNTFPRGTERAVLVRWCETTEEII